MRNYIVHYSSKLFSGWSPEVAETPTQAREMVEQRGYRVLNVVDVTDEDYE